ncbi:uncharacterized protein LOC141620271 [Silene latifolia]|uniref:uncharacterized protein LOC141620271 n=1 Tax=Silene latifolia TaxID=37657 RepID=UPI003D77AFBC
MVYGSNNATFRRALWDSLVTHSTTVGAWVAMGDFNIIRSAQEKFSNTPPDHADITEFNACLDVCGLDDLSGSGSEFTWFNKQDPSTRVYSKLDKILTNAKWTLAFTQTSASFLAPTVSDHCPGLLTFYDDPFPKKQFKFLNCWIDHPDYKHKVREA